MSGDGFAAILRLIWWGLWTVVCVNVFLILSLPLMVAGLGVGGLVGAAVAVYSLGASLTGRAPGHVVMTPALVAKGALPGRVDNQHVRRDRAWPQYFVSQVRLDLGCAVATGRRIGTALCRWSVRWLRTSTGRKIFYLWPAIAVGASAVAGMVAVDILFLAAAVAVTAALTTLLWIVGVTAVMLLRYLDRIRQIVFRASASCPRCYAVTALPAYQCPGPHTPQDRLAGDDLHRDIRPGRLGVLWRRCACGKLLPTTVLRASRKATARCPLCQEPMHRGAGVATDVRVPVFGATSAGKTHLIVSAVVYMMDPACQAEGGPSVSLIDDHSSRRYEQYRALVANDRPVPKTDAATPPVALTLQIDDGRRGTLLHVFDAAGEALADPDTNAGYAFLDYARTLVFVLDPFSIPAFRDQIGEDFTGLVDEANAAQTDPTDSYQVTVRRLRASGVRTERQRLAIVLSKRDLLARLPLTDRLPTGSVEIREWLHNQGLDNLVIGAERDFNEVRYFAVSSRDRSAGGPYSAFRWLLDTDRLALPRVPGIPRHRAGSATVQPPVRPKVSRS